MWKSAFKTLADPSVHLLNNCEGVKNPSVSYCEDVFGTKAVVINFQTLF